MIDGKVLTGGEEVEKFEGVAYECLAQTVGHRRTHTSSKS
jgi:hypothetical protein